jgi:hypothetical protein
MPSGLNYSIIVECDIIGYKKKKKEDIYRVTNPGYVIPPGTSFSFN